MLEALKRATVRDVKIHLIAESSPDGKRNKICNLINKAKNSIKIYQQDITDHGIMERLLQSAKNGIKIELIMSPHPFGVNNPDNNIKNQKDLAAAGGSVYLINTVNVHAKVLIIDDQTMYLGSTNFYQPAIDKNRTVGLVIQNNAIIAKILEVFESDKTKAEKVLTNS